MLAQHICSMYSMKLTEVHFQLPPYKYYCYFTSFAVLSPRLTRIHNLMGFLALPLSLYLYHFVEIFCMLLIFAILLFLLNKCSYAIPSYVCFSSSDSHPVRNFVDFYFYFNFHKSFHRTKWKTFFCCCKNVFIRESFLMSFSWYHSVGVKK